MKFKEEIYEIVMTINEIGIIDEIAFPNNDVSHYFEVGKNFLYKVDPESLTKALSFMLQLSTSQFASNHEVNFIVNNEIKMIYLSGFLRNKQYMVIATTRTDALNSLNEELMKINSEQVNSFRLLLKETLKSQEKQSKNSVNYFDEISKLNNELANSHRELARKNQELNKLNSDLERMATRDPLTGLYNRRLVFEKFLEEKRRANRLSYPLSLVVIDINHFKKVNDQLGHAAGDDLLIRLSNLILKLTRESLDSAFRIGGDEFLLLLANCDKTSASLILDRLNGEFAKLTDIATLAYGVVEIDSDCEEDLDRCIMAADQLMFENKQGSR